MAMLISALVIIALLGYLAQTTGLCMARGVSEFRRGDPGFLIAILVSGVFAWVSAIFSYALDIPLSFITYAASGWFALGGFLFGLGTALNQGCGVSTLSKLSRGDIKMVATIMGWLLGWCILAAWRPDITVTAIDLPSKYTYGVLIIASLAIVVWSLLGDAQRKKRWLSISGIGLLAGFLFLYEPHWTPSGLLHTVSKAIVSDTGAPWPSVEQYLLFVALLAGMFLAAWRTKRFVFVRSHWRQWLLHIMAGSLMGIGASLALGGNDSQLLLALPTFSSAGFVAVASMLLGIWFAMVVKEKLQVFE